MRHHESWVVIYAAGRHVHCRSCRIRRRTWSAAPPSAPLYFVRVGSDEDLAAGFEIAGRLAADPEPVVHKAVGIFVKHAGTRSPERLRSFLEQHAGTMHRSGLRLAIEKLDTDTRSHYLSR